MEGVVSLPLEETQLNFLVTQAKDFAMSHGVVYRTTDHPLSADVAIHAPFQLFPSPVPRHCYEQAVAIQQDYNLLMHRVAHDYDFLKDCLKSTIKVDDFTRRFWEIYETVRSEGIAQPVSLAMNRSDYMFNQVGGEGSDVASLELKQIEFNTMASSFGGLSENITQLHRYVLQISRQAEKIKDLPPNTCVTELSDALYTAWTVYNNEAAVVTMLVLEEERNMYDQRILEHALVMKDPKLRVVRKTLKDFEERGKLGEDRKLLIDGDEVAVVYFRTCYVPTHFSTDKSWAARLLIERSAAIKCPNVHYFLSGTKKVQQMLAQPGVVEKFIPDPERARQIRATFAGQYTLDLGEEGDKAVEMATKQPHNFVLKPQREGGGNNTFGDAIPRLLEKIKNSEERAAYILMELIRPVHVRNYPIRSSGGSDIGSGSVASRLQPPTDMISELGIFGTLVGSADKIYRNSHGGHILRTKTLGTDEGGVAAGFSALDSPYLVG